MNFKRKLQANGPVAKRRRTQEPTRHEERPIQMPRELSFKISRSLRKLNKKLYKRRTQEKVEEARLQRERRLQEQELDTHFFAGSHWTVKPKYCDTHQCSYMTPECNRCAN